jgi:uridine monophosphate synthetase
MSFPLSPENRRLALALRQIGAIRLGQFTLHSGRSSPIYLDLRLLVSFPAVLRQAAAAYAALLEPLEYNLLAATPLAGLPIGTAVCLATNQPLIYPRPAAKGYGTGQRIEGAFRPGQTAVALDDVITSGDSLLQAIGALEAAGLLVRDVVVLVDRQQGGAEALAERGYRLHAAMTLAWLLEITG